MIKTRRGHITSFRLFHTELFASKLQSTLRDDRSTAYAHEDKRTCVCRRNDVWRRTVARCCCSLVILCSIFKRNFAVGKTWQLDHLYTCFKSLAPRMCHTGFLPKVKRSLDWRCPAPLAIWQGIWLASSTSHFLSEDD